MLLLPGKEGNEGMCGDVGKQWYTEIRKRCYGLGLVYGGVSEMPHWLGCAGGQCMLESIHGSAQKVLCRLNREQGKRHGSRVWGHRICRVAMWVN